MILYKVVTLLCLTLALTDATQRSSVRRQVQQLSEFNNLDKTLQEFYPRLDQITVEGAFNCFHHPFVNKENVLFQNSTKLLDIVEDYFHRFSDHIITDERVKNLIRSLEHIIEHVAQCSVMLEYHYNHEGLIQSNRSSSTGHKDVHFYKLGLNSMSDKSKQEIDLLTGIDNFHRNKVQRSNDVMSLFRNAQWTRKYQRGQCATPENKVFPEKFDYRQQFPAIGVVRNQGACGSCWAFATADSIRGSMMLKIKSDRIPPLSTQYFLDFDQENLGCNGGDGGYAFDFAKNNGVVLESEYPYQGVETRNSRPRATFGIQNFCHRRYEITDNEIIWALTRFGPLYITINADSASFANYQSGVFDLRQCSLETTHAMVLTGYDAQSWIIKNSWGKDWGENGFIRVARHRNTCGVQQEFGYSIV